MRDLFRATMTCRRHSAVDHQAIVNRSCAFAGAVHGPDKIAQVREVVILLPRHFGTFTQGDEKRLVFGAGSIAVVGVGLDDRAIVDTDSMQQLRIGKPTL